jgi:hypothetical protein
LTAHPESFQVESRGQRIFVNAPGANEIDVLDKDMKSILSRWTPGHMRSNYPMALDESAHRLFVGIRWPSELRMFDTETGKSIVDVPSDGDVDDIFLDSAHGIVVLACGAGFLDIVHLKGIDRFGDVERLPTAKGARTGLLDSRQGRFYLAVPAKGSRPAEVRIYPMHSGGK